MFRHKGNRRTFSHNLKLASTLSFIAGIVNVVGVLSVLTLTTNVTGHFAYFAEAIFLKNYGKAITIITYVFFFLLGAFICNILIELVSKYKAKFAHTFPMLVELIILVLIGLSVTVNPNHIAHSLLFAMGLQNALVTQISQSTVRTTHLTGLFTDLGIELSQLFFYRKAMERKRLSKSIFLRLSIIFFFFTGCLFGGYFFNFYQLKTLLFAALILLIGLIFDNLIMFYYITKRKIKRNLNKI